MGESKKVLITGGLGFLGSNLTKSCIEDGHEVTVVDCSTNLRNVWDMEGQYELIQACIARDTFWRDYCKDKDAVFHLAANVSHILAEKDPYLDVNSNIIGTINLLEGIRKLEHKPRLVYACCLSEDSRVFTQSGLKQWHELSEGELVYSINPVTKVMELKPIVKVLTFPFRGSLVNMDGEHIRSKSTPNHRMLIETDGGNLIERTSMQILDRKDNTRFLKSIWRGSDIPIDIDMDKSDFMYLLGIYVGDRSRQLHYYTSDSGLNRGRFITVDHGSQSRKTNDSMYLHLPRGSVDRVTLILEKYGITVHSYKDRIMFTHPELQSLLSECGNSVHDKHIPLKYKSATPSLLSPLMDGLMDSSGSKNRIYTISRELSNDVAEVMIKLGKWATISTIPPRDSLIYGSETYVINMSATTPTITPSSITMEKYNGIVWCLEVQDNENFLSELDGKFMYTGNSRSVYGYTPLSTLPVTEDHVPNPLDSYGISKLAAEKYILKYSHHDEIPSVSLRMANLVGPRQGLHTRAYQMISWIFRCVSRDETIGFWGDGLQTRDFLYVGDAVNAYKTIGLSDRGWENCKTGDYFNLPGGEYSTWLKAIQTCGKTLNKSPRIQFEPYPPLRSKLENEHSKLDGTKLSYRFGIKNETPLSVAFDEMSKYYKGRWDDYLYEGVLV